MCSDNVGTGGFGSSGEDIRIPGPRDSRRTGDDRCAVGAQYISALWRVNRSITGKGPSGLSAGHRTKDGRILSVGKAKETKDGIHRTTIGI